MDGQMDGQVCFTFAAWFSLSRTISVCMSICEKAPVISVAGKWMVIVTYFAYSPIC
jgi:hypothetical protein